MFILWSQLEGQYSNLRFRKALNGNTSDNVTQYSLSYPLYCMRYLGTRTFMEMSFTKLNSEWWLGFIIDIVHTLAGETMYGRAQNKIACSTYYFIALIFLHTISYFHTTLFTQNPDFATLIIHYYLNNIISELAALSVRLVTRISENSSFYQY